MGFDLAREALEPCPFCGGAASVRPDEVGIGGQHIGPYWAGCPMPWGCGVVFQGDDPEEAAEAWNRRARTAYDAIGSGVKALRQQARRVRNYSNPDDVFYAVPVSALGDEIAGPASTEDACSVRKLEWRKSVQEPARSISKDDGGVRIDSEETTVGQWSVQSFDQNQTFHVLGTITPGIRNVHTTIDEAKAAAQADFERRVLSCLSTHTANAVQCETCDGTGSVVTDQPEANDSGHYIEQGCPDCNPVVRAALSTHTAAGAGPVGDYVLVPRAPTEAMLDAAVEKLADDIEGGMSDRDFIGAAYRRLLAAAPATHTAAGAVPADVRALVIAARNVAFDDAPSPEALKALDDASEAFAARVPWEDAS